MTVSSHATTRTRRRRSRHFVRATNLAVFFFWVIFISSHLCLSSAKHGSVARFSGPVNSFHSASRPAPVMGSNGGDRDSDGTVYGEDDRVVHTGPNPLHN
ncbi:hypothetical protein ACSBR1_040264 [Camellia fascicularis]